MTHNVFGGTLNLTQPTNLEARLASNPNFDFGLDLGLGLNI